MPAPHEIIVGPAEVYWAPVGEAFPDIDEVPAGNWKLIGTLGSENYGESGVLIRSPRTTNPVRVLGSTTPRKHVITTTELQVEFDVIDADPEHLSLGYGVDPTTVTDVAPGSGTAGYESFNFPTSPVPFQAAILVRIAQSPFGDNLNSQLQIAAANQVGNGESGFTKSDPFMLKHIWDTVKTVGEPFATWVFQSDPAAS